MLNSCLPHIEHQKANPVLLSPPPAQQALIRAVPATEPEQRRDPYEPLHLIQTAQAQLNHTVKGKYLKKYFDNLEKTNIFRPSSGRKREKLNKILIAYADLEVFLKFLMIQAACKGVGLDAISF